MVGGVKGGASLSTNVHTVILTHGWEVKKARCDNCLGKGTVIRQSQSSEAEHLVCGTEGAD